MSEELNLPVNNPSSLTVPGANASDVAAAVGAENVTATVSLKDVVNQAVGRAYASDEEALKGIVNTYRKIGEQPPVVIPPSTTSSLPAEVLAKLGEVDSLRATVEKSQFYQDHPEYNTPEAKQLIEAMGPNPATVVNSDAFKMAFGAVQSHITQEKSKSVLMSNPRLGIVTDKISEAREARKSATAATRDGDVTAATAYQSVAAKAAVAAVLESLQP